MSDHITHIPITGGDSTFMNAKRAHRLCGNRGTRGALDLAVVHSLTIPNVSKDKGTLAVQAGYNTCTRDLP